MKALINTWNALKEDESGQDLIEYALIASLVGLVSVAALTSLQTAIAGAFTRISTALTPAG
jgi:pilus assembly protein Flp/PilA